MPMEHSFRDICGKRFLSLRYHARLPLGRLSSSKPRGEDIRIRNFFQLLNQESKKVFGQSFEDADPEGYISVDHLFRNQDQIAHRGHSQDVDLPSIMEWFKAADSLLLWLVRVSH